MLEKICISGTCTLKSKCYLWRRAVTELHQQWISPEKTGDSCHFYHERLNYGHGKVEEEND